jgi:HSP20 family protein
MTMQNQAPPVKLYRSEDRVTIAAPMPGLEPQDINVAVTEDGKLTLFGELRGEMKGDKDVILDEWNPGPYRRSIDLPEAVDGSSANATYNNGVLVVSLLTSNSTVPAAIELDRVSATKGIQVGSAGKDGGSDA